MMLQTVILQAAPESGGQGWIAIVVVAFIALVLCFVKYREKEEESKSAEKQPTHPQAQSSLHSAPQPTPTRPANATNSIKQQLAELKELLDAGVITQEDYDKHKSTLISKL